MSFRVFPQSPPPCPMGFWKKVAIVSGMEVMDGLSNMVFYLWRLICQPANSRGQLWTPDMASFLTGWDSHLVAGWLHWPHPSWKKQCFVLTGRNTLDMDLFSLPSVLLPKPPSVDLHNMICSKVYPQHCSWPRNSFNSSWSVAMDLCWWNSLILPCSPSPWNLWPDRILEKPFEDLVFMASGWQHLVWLWWSPLGCGICSKLVTNVWCYFLYH